MDGELDPVWRYGALSSRAYDADKPIGFSFGDVEFYTDLLADVRGEIVEPAVGNGRLLVPLARRGHVVRGYDSSPFMVELCRANCAAHGVGAEVFRDELLAHRAPGRYAAVVVPAGSFSLLPSRGAAGRALVGIHESLVSGGRFVCDLEPPPAAADITTGPRQWWVGDELITLSSMHTEVDPLAQRTTEWLRYELWRDGALHHTELQIFSLLWFGLAEFTALLRDAGFVSVRVYGDYTDTAPVPESNTWTFEAVRG